MSRHTSGFLAVALCGLASMPVATARCFPDRPFGQYPDEGEEWRWVAFPSGTPATWESIIGRFWQPGQYQTTNQGTCDESTWLVPCDDAICNGATSPSFYIWQNFESCFNPGCVAQEMLLLIEDRSWGGVFAVARVDETPGGDPFSYNFWRVGRNIELVPIPKPYVTSAQTVGSLTRVTYRFDDPAPGFYGLPGVTANGTITAIKLYSRVAASPNPVERSGWTFRARFPYVGGETIGTVDFDQDEFCPGGGYHFAVAAALEFDGGQVESEYVSVPNSAACVPETFTGLSRVPEEGADALYAARDNSGDVTLAWGAVCIPLGASYSVYEGTIGDWTSHVPVTCASGGTSATLTPAMESSYYLVVPYASSTGVPMDFEGSYGLMSNGVEREPSAAACAPSQWVRDCP